MTVAPVNTSPAAASTAAMSASLIRPGGYGRARVLDDVGHLALQRAPGLRCLTWSRPSGLAGGWDLGPAGRTHATAGRCRNRLA